MASCHSSSMGFNPQIHHAKSGLRLKVTERRLLVLLPLLAIATIVYSQFEVWTLNFTYELAVMTRFWAWQATFWLISGLLVAIAYWSSSGKPVTAFGLFLTFFFFYLSAALDWMHIIFGWGYVPSPEYIWFWSPFYWHFGLSWTTTLQTIWTLIWLSAIPLTWFLIAKLSGEPS